MERITVWVLSSPAVVPITMPSTSPMAQPVRQCKVALAAVDHDTEVQLIGCWAWSSRVGSSAVRSDMSSSVDVRSGPPRLRGLLSGIAVVTPPGGAGGDGGEQGQG